MLERCTCVPMSYLQHFRHQDYENSDQMLKRKRWHEGNSLFVLKFSKFFCFHVTFWLFFQMCLWIYDKKCTDRSVVHVYIFSYK